MSHDKQLEWKELKRKALINSEWFTAESRTYLLPNGKVDSEHYVVAEKPGTTIVALTQEGKILVVKQFRTAVNQVIYDLPGGGVEKSEAGVLETAKRELLEETGYTSESWQYVTMFYPMPNRVSSECHVLYATGCQKVGQPDPDASEFVVVEEKTLAEFESMITRDDFRCGICQLAWYRVKEKFSLG